MREWIVILLLSSAVGASACGRTAGDNSDGPQSNGGAAAWSMTIEPVDSPAGPNSSEPQLTASDRGIILSWVERAGATGAPQVRRTYVLRLERTHNGGIWQQLVPELCGPANGSAPSQRYSDRELARVDEPRLRRQRPTGVIFARQREDLGSAVRSPSRRHGTAACVCVLFRAARKRARGELARRKGYPTERCQSQRWTHGPSLCRLRRPVEADRGRCR